MANRIDKLRGRASDIIREKRDISEREDINIADLSILSELTGFSLRDDESVRDIKSLSQAVSTEQEIIEDKIRENISDKQDALEETDGFIDELKDTIQKYEEMEKATDLLNLDSQKRENRAKVDDLNEVKRLLGAETSNDYSATVNAIDAERYVYEDIDSVNESTIENDEKQNLAWIQPYSEGYNKMMYPDNLGGVVRGMPMSYEDANHGKPNPNYHLNTGYQRNCASCVVAYEARLRGYDVQTKPNTWHSKVRELSYATNTAWIDPSTGTYPKYVQMDSGASTPDMFIDFLEKTVRQGERYTLQFSYPNTKRRAAGHIISVDRDETGQLRFYDPQMIAPIGGRGIRRTNTARDEIRPYLEVAVDLNKCRYPKMLRIDDKFFNPEIADHIMEGWGA